MHSSLTRGRLFSRLRLMAPEPQPTSKQVCWMSEPAPDPVFKSLSTSSTSSCTHSKNSVGSLVVRRVLCSHFLWANLSFRSGYEDWWPHLQRQISEVPLLYHILNRHSKTIKYVYEMIYVYDDALKTHQSWDNRYEGGAPEVPHLDRRLVQSRHICSVLSCPRSSDNFESSTLSICKNR